MNPGVVVIDTRCELNLLATRHELELVKALGLRLLDTPLVSGEPLFTWTEPDEDGNRSKEPSSTERLRSAGYLDTRSLDTDALIDAFVAAAERITDADASCIALAGVLNVPLFTDDRKERRVAKELFPRIEFVSTLEVLESGAQSLAWNQQYLARVAHNLRWRGNFAPPRQDPRAAWYQTLLDP